MSHSIKRRRHNNAGRNRARLADFAVRNFAIQSIFAMVNDTNHVGLERTLETVDGDHARRVNPLFHGDRRPIVVGRGGGTVENGDAHVRAEVNQREPSSFIVAESASLFEVDVLASIGVEDADGFRAIVKSNFGNIFGGAAGSSRQTKRGNGKARCTAK